MFLVPLLTSRRMSPGDDFISALLAMDELTLDEILATCILLLAAGHETTANLIANGTLALIEHPSQRELLLADPATAVEELIRFTRPVRLAGRIAMTDQVVGEVKVPAGSQVFVHIDEANRDTRRWDDADKLNLARSGPAHLGFGGGMHFCLGAALARMEAGEALTGLFGAYPELELAGGGVEWRESTTFRGVRGLAVNVRG